MSYEDAPAVLQQGNPFRVPDWRWLRAKGVLNSTGRCCPTLDDAETIELVDFVRAERQCVTPRQRTSLANKWMHLLLAKAIWESKSPQRGLLEARLLAGSTDAEIAQAMKIDPETVAWFERAFFQVRGRLKASDWITFRVLRSDGEAPDYDFMRTMKEMAYHGGIVLLDACIEAFADQIDPQRQFLKLPKAPSYTDARRTFIIRSLFNIHSSRCPRMLVETLKAYMAAAKLDHQQNKVPPIMPNDPEFLRMANMLFEMIGTSRSTEVPRKPKAPSKPKQGGPKATSQSTSTKPAPKRQSKRTAP